MVGGFWDSFINSRRGSFYTRGILMEVSKRPTTCFLCKALIAIHIPSKDGHWFCSLRCREKYELMINNEYSLAQWWEDSACYSIECLPKPNLRVPMRAQGENAHNPRYLGYRITPEDAAYLKLMHIIW
jgi:hypothetical protein